MSRGTVNSSRWPLEDEVEIYAYTRIDFNVSLGGGARTRNRQIRIGRVSESTGLRGRALASRIFDLSTTVAGAQHSHVRTDNVSAFRQKPLEIKKIYKFNNIKG